MAENPGESYSLASRLVCAKCWCEPRIVNASTIKGSDFDVTVECHGERETRHLTRSMLVFTQKFFVQAGQED
jgi:hypothetical protein